VFISLIVLLYMFRHTTAIVSRYWQVRHRVNTPVIDKLSLLKPII